VYARLASTFVSSQQSEQGGKMSSSFRRIVYLDGIIRRVSVALLEVVIPMARGWML
jgi:hypothetical protein